MEDQDPFKPLRTYQELFYKSRKIITFHLKTRGSHENKYGLPVMFILLSCGGGDRDRKAYRPVPGAPPCRLLNVPSAPSSRRHQI